MIPNVNVALMKTFWRERLTSPIRLFLLVAFWLLPVALTFLHQPVRLTNASLTLFATVVLGGGVIGRDLSTGVIQLILARPVTRTEYVVSRWMGLGLVSFALAFLGWAVVLPFSLLQGGATITEALASLLEHFLNAFGMAAILTGLSAVLPGFFDLAMLAVSMILSTIIGQIGSATQTFWLVRVGHEVQTTFFPYFELKDITAGHAFHPYPLAAYLSSVTLILLLGIVALNRRELTYATAG